MKSIGKITYSPRSHLGSNDKWAAVLCDDEISKYYRHLFTKQYPYLNGERTGKIGRPIWGAHISFCRGFEKPNPKLWRADEGKLIEFEYEGGVLDNNTYYWLRVNCPALLDLREKLGLSRVPKFGLHMTIGISTSNQ
jgi:hypothetical protein